MDFADATFDVIIALEVLEHIPRPNLEPVLEEWNRVCKRGGFIVISTPNAEDIDSGKILCPECGCIFHKGQHVSAWDRNSLVSLMEQLGFSTIDCRALTLRSKSVLNPLRELAAIFLKQKRLNLLYVGRKD